MNTYDGQCGSCINLNINDWCGHKNRCRCTERGFYVDLDDRYCYKYEYAPNRDYYDLNHRWHIVCAIFEVLGLNFDFDCTKLIAGFRNEYLESNDKYIEFLNDYDKYGKIIADRIRISEDRVNICKNLARTYLVRFFDLIKSNRIDEAFELYSSMYNLLKNTYVDFSEIYEKNSIKVK